MGSTTKERKPNIDLLRLVCMLMVVSLHYFGWGGKSCRGSIQI